jgi:hypothetical protein
VMEQPQQNDKAEAEEKKPDAEFTKSREYKRFKKLLRKVVKAPPMRKDKGRVADP